MTPNLENFNNKPITINTDCINAMVIIAQLQLAIRHPENTGPSRYITEKFARKLQEAVVSVNPEFSLVLDRGWQPEYDFTKENMY